MIIDSNMYWFPEELFTNQEKIDRFLEEIPREYGIYGYIKKNEDTGKYQYVIEKPIGCQNLNYVQGEYLLEKQLADMDAAGVEKAVLKLSCQQEWMSLDMCKFFNDGMAEQVKKSNGRMTALAVVPPKGIPAVFREIDRCFDDLKMTGVQLSAHYGNLYLDDEAFTSFFQYLNKKHATVYVHHSPVPVQYNSLCDYNNLRRSYGRCVDQCTAVGRELFSGFFDKFPNLKFVHSMLGGGFFAYANIWFPHKPKDAESVNRFTTADDSVFGHLKNNLYFEMSHAQPWGKEQLECAIHTLGADHILFGTSYPVRKEWLTEGAKFVQGLNITEEEKELILHKNAERLYQV